MGPAPKRGIDHKPRTKDFTKNWSHESQTSILTFFSIIKFQRWDFFFSSSLRNRGVSDLRGKEKKRLVFAGEEMVEIRRFGEMGFSP